MEIDDRIVVAEIQNGSGGWIGDEVEGQMHPGLQTWRHTSNGMLTVVRVLSKQATPWNPRLDKPTLG